MSSVKGEQLYNFIEKLHLQSANVLFPVSRQGQQFRYLASQVQMCSKFTKIAETKGIELVGKSATHKLSALSSIHARASWRGTQIRLQSMLKVRMNRSHAQI